MGPAIKYSVVIPVYNSEPIVATTVQRTQSFFESNKLPYEIILVNDGSSDNSWQVIEKIARDSEHVVAINLLHNYGQHSANLCGFKYSTGDYVITMDDDLQNPPEEIAHLIAQAKHGNHDLVIGQFREKKHVLYRRVGTVLIRAINQRIFGSPKDLVLTNFRIIRRDVVDRICNYRTSYPYVPGLALMFSNNRANVLVEHQERSAGKSNYNLLKILKLVSTILFNYSSYPLRLVSGIGMGLSLLSFLLGAFYLVTAMIKGTNVPGWTSLIVLVSFYNGVIMLLLGMLGEYSVRLLRQSSAVDSYHIKKIVGGSE